MKSKFKKGSKIKASKPKSNKFNKLKILSIAIIHDNKQTELLKSIKDKVFNDKRLTKEESAILLFLESAF